MKYDLTREDLEQHLRDQVDFLRRSAAAYDQGAEGEAKRLATTLRVLLHDTSRSQSLLALLKIKKSRLRLLDTAEPIDPQNLLSTPGLVMLRMSSETGGAYIPRLGDLPPPLQGRTKLFDPWWSEPVTKDATGNLFCRQDYVLTVSNKEGRRAR